MSKAAQLLLAVLLAVGGVIAAGSIEGRVVFAGDAPPECRYDDIRTRYPQPADWKITLLDSIYRVPRSYWPSGLVSTANAGLNGGERVRRLVIADLRAMGAAAHKQSGGVRVVSAYRSYSEQASLYRQEVNRYGVAAARLMVARPGHSEHHLGTTIDFSSANSNKKGWHYNDWAETPAGSWMRANAWRFGFVMSYPKARQQVTCYRYEPWHYRYVGRELAAKVRANGLTLREYLWREYH